MSASFENALTLCIDKVRRGEWTIEQCLERFPEFQAKLLPLLHLALKLDVSSAPPQPMPAAAKARIRESLLAKMPAGEIAAQPVSVTVPDRARPSWLGNLLLRPRWASAVAIVALVLSTGGLAAAASASDASSPLFPVKRAMENIRVLLTPSQAGRADLHVKYAERRAKEADRLSGTKPEAAKRTLELMDRELKTARSAAAEVESERAEGIQSRIEDLSGRHHELRSRLEERGKPGVGPAEGTRGRPGPGGEDEDKAKPGRKGKGKGQDKQAAPPVERGKGIPGGEAIEPEAGPGPAEPSRKRDGGKETPEATQPGEGSGPSGKVEDGSGKDTGNSGDIKPAPKDKKAGKLNKRGGKKPNKADPTTTTLRSGEPRGTSPRTESTSGTNQTQGERSGLSDNSDPEKPSNSPRRAAE